MKASPIPQSPDALDCWEGTTSVSCPCGGSIEWAEGGYVPGSRACRSCLVLFRVRGSGLDRQIVPQTCDNEGIIRDASLGDELQHVPENLYPGWKVRV